MKNKDINWIISHREGSQMLDLVPSKPVIIKNNKIAINKFIQNLPEYLKADEITLGILPISKTREAYVNKIMWRPKREEYPEMNSLDDFLNGQFGVPGTLVK